MRALKRTTTALFFIAALQIGASSARATPAQVVIIRHAEKDLSSGNLNARGWERAKALVSYFKTAPEVTKFGTPAAIYATGAKYDDSAVRTIQTVTPLAESLGLKLNTEFYKKDREQLADDILNNADYDGRMVLISWKHSGIPKLAAAFGYDQAPDWGDEVFDRVWILTFSGDRVTRFEDLPQRILPGDSSRLTSH